jgi:DNA replication protein
MKVFSGFPAGKLAVTPLPNLFFTELLPAIEDAAELRVTLYIFWLIANAKSKTQFVAASELHTDRTLMQSIAADELTRVLDVAVTRGTLLRLEGEDDLFFVNSDAGRRAFEKMEKEKLPVRSTIGHVAPDSSRPNIFTLYEQNIGLLTPIIAEELKDAEKEYPADWIAEAFKIAVEQNVRKWSYVQKILERWQTEGKAGEGKKRKTWYTDEHAKHINR